MTDTRFLSVYFYLFQYIHAKVVQCFLFFFVFRYFVSPGSVSMICIGEGRFRILGGGGGGGGYFVSPGSVSMICIGEGRLRILGGGGGARFRRARGGTKSQQAHDVVLTSIRRNDVASTSFRRHVHTRFLINQCQISNLKI